MKHIILVLFFCSLTHAAVARIASASLNTSSGSGTLTTSAIDSTGATFFTIDIIWDSAGDGVLPSFSDSKGSTWTTCGTARTGASTRHIKTCYVGIASGDTTHAGTSHTMTIGADTDNITFTFTAWSGVGGTGTIFVTENGAYDAGFTTATGSATPSAAGDLVTSCYTENNVNDTLTPFGTPNYYGSSGHQCAWIESPNTSALSPTWSAFATNGHAANIQIFTTAAGGGGSSAVKRRQIN